MRALILSLALAGCAGGVGQHGAYLRAEDLLPEAGSWLQFGPEDDPGGGEQLILKVEEILWTFRLGEQWAGAAEVASFTVARHDGLVVGGERLLPSEVEEGAMLDDLEVLSIGEVEVYYGRFPAAATVERASGRLAGTWAFAHVGPVLLHLDGEAWELSYYQ